MVGEPLEDFYGGSTGIMHLREQVNNCLLRDDRGADLVVGFEFVTFCNSRAVSVEIYFPIESGTYVAFRPMEQTLVIPLRNSTKMPLVPANKHQNSKNFAEVSYRLIGISKSAM